MQEIKDALTEAHMALSLAVRLAGEQDEVHIKSRLEAIVDALLYLQESTDIKERTVELVNKKDMDELRETVTLVKPDHPDVGTPVRAAWQIIRDLQTVVQMAGLGNDKEA